MLSKVGSEVLKIPCIDEFDETGTGTKRAASELEMLKKKIVTQLLVWRQN